MTPSPPNTTSAASPAPPRSTPAPTRRGRIERWLAAGIAVFVVLGSAFAFDAVVRAMNIRLAKEPIYPAGNIRFHTLNNAADGSRVRLDNFRIESDATVSPEELEELGTDNYLSRWYQALNPPFESDSPVFIQLHLAYYTGMIDTVPHVPERCMVGAGMQMTAAPRLVDIPLTFSEAPGKPGFTEASGLDESIHATIYSGRCSESFQRIRLPQGIEDLRLNVSGYTDAEGRRIYAGYFFISNGRIFPTAIGVRQSGISLVDEYAYYAKVQFMSSTVDSPEQLGILAGQLMNWTLA